MNHSPKRILLVDNDPHVLQATKLLLTVAGYQVVTATNVQEALASLRDEIIHAAIIDIRLNNEDNNVDQSGLFVAQKTPSYIPCVIYSAYIDLDDISSLLKRGIQGILPKSAPNSAAKLVEIIDDIFNTIVKVNFGLQIDGDIDMEEIASPIELPTDLLPRPTEADVQHLFQSLFYDTIGINVNPLSSIRQANHSYQSGSYLVRVHPHFHNGHGAPLVVKFSSRDEIDKEHTNYHIIKPFVGGHRLAILESVHYSRQVGGLVYRLFGAEKWESIREFSEIFAQENSEKLVKLLNQFFGQTFGSLYKEAPYETINLGLKCVEELHLNPTRLRSSMSRLRPDVLSEPQIHFRGIPQGFINPILWISPNGEFRNINIFTRVCLCHGDLHGRNILVDEGGHFWLIDFARVEKNSHALRDFVQLETDIKFCLLRVIDLEALLPFEHALLTPSAFGTAPPAGSFDNDRLDHAYQVITGLRAIAADLLKLNGDIREYYQALLFHTLNVMRLRHISDEKKEYALLSAALICERLDSWPQWEVRPMPSPPAPPASAPAPTSLATRVAGIWDRRLLIGGVVSLVGAFAVALWLSAPPIAPAITGAITFLLFGASIIAFMWWAMQAFRPSWRSHVAVLIYLPVLIITVFGLLGLVSGTEVVQVLRKIINGIIPQLAAP